MPQDNPWKNYFDANQNLWDERVKVHSDSAFYGVPQFLAGESTLREIELAELGDVSGKKLLHLQCHFGLDTLSWARLGASVTGMDFSEPAILKARELAAQTGLDATFVCCNVFDLPQHLSGEFDIVFTSYGVIGWLPDLKPWAKVVSHFLKPGGTFYMAEFHPFIWMYDNQREKVAYSYFNREVISEEVSGSYASDEGLVGGMEYGWNHGLSEVFGVLMAEGLQLVSFQEHSFSPWPCFADMEEVGKDRYLLKVFGDKIPYVYSVSFRK